MSTYTYTTLDDPLSGGDFTFATGINALGQIVGYYYDASGGSAHGFLYSGGAYTTIDDPLGTCGTFAQGINALGQIVGYYLDSAGIQHGFLYSGGTWWNCFRIDPAVAGAAVHETENGTHRRINHLRFTSARGR
jgi:probable HAF family extracellular repeat protein